MDVDPNKDKPGAAKTQAQIPDVQDGMEMVRTYGPAAAIGIVLALVIFLGLTFHRHKQASAREQAAHLFMQAQNADQLQLIVDEYPQTVTAPMALLALASERYHEGAADLADMHYRQFIERYADHIMRPAAELGLAYCHEAMGRFGDALSGFRAFVAANGDHYLAPQARLGEARVLVQTGQYDAARAIYNEILDDPDHPWTAQANSDLMYMEKELRAQSAAAPTEE